MKFESFQSERKRMLLFAVVREGVTKGEGGAATGWETCPPRAPQKTRARTPNWQSSSSSELNIIQLFYREKKQAGTGPSRRHIKGSKIAKRHQNAKVLVNWGPFDENTISDGSFSFFKSLSRNKPSEITDFLVFIHHVFHYLLLECS